MLRKNILLKSLLILSLFLLPSFCRAAPMPPGTLLYRTTDEGKMYGYSSDSLIEVEKGIMKSINPGHVGIYVGEENGQKYVVEALANGVVKVPLEHFINEALGEKFIGAKIPKNLDPISQSKAVYLAKTIAEANMVYDFDFKKQKGPGSGEWTCVGLAEKIYESAGAINPFNLESLEYDEEKYAFNITPDGFDDYSVINSEGDCFSSDKEFSFISPRSETILPFPEKIGFNAGLIYQGKRYIFLPYTQFLQSSLEDVEVTEKISSYFEARDIRGGVKAGGLLARWSLINNPLSSLKILSDKTTGFINNSFNSILAFFSGDKNKDISLPTFANEQDNYGPQENILDSTPSKISGLNVNVKSTVSEKESLAKTASSSSIKVDNPSKATSSSTISSLNVSTATPSNLGGDKTATSSSSNNSSTTNSNNTNTNISTNPSTNPNNSPSTNPVSNAPLKNIIISKVYATEKDDFIELYNPNQVQVDLAALNYRLEKTKSAVDPTLIFRIGHESDGTYPGGTIIPALGYYLIVRSEAIDYYLQRADAIVSRKEFDLSPADQTIYLGVGAISSYSDEDIVDVLGYGDNATYFLGSKPAVKIEDYHFLNRISDKKDNRLDFSLLLSSEPSALAAWQAQNQSSLDQEEKIPTSTPELIFPGEPAEPEEPINPEDPVEPSEPSEPEESIDPVEPIEPEEPIDPVEPIEPPEPEDPEGTQDPPEVFEPELSEEDEERLLQDDLRSVLFNKVGAEGNDDFIELYNHSNRDIDLALFNFRLEKSKTALDPSILLRIGDLSDAYYPGGTIIPANETYLIVRESAHENLLAMAHAIVIRSDFNLPQSGQSVYLGIGPISSPSDEDIIDLVGYGSEAIYFLGSNPAPKINNSNILIRHNYSHDNLNDFIEERYDTFFLKNNEPENEDFNPQTSQYKEGIKNLWHFDDCSADEGGVAALGKWECGIEIGNYYGNLMHNFPDDINLDNFSLSFYYKPAKDWPSLFFSLSNNSGNFLSFSLEMGQIFSSGIFGTENIFLENSNQFSDNWHHFVFTINKNDSYFSIYIDGVEVLRRNFLMSLPDINRLVLTGGIGSTFFDELVVWEKTLLHEEINEIISNDKPFFPIAKKMEKKNPELLFHFDFNEGLGGQSFDKSGQEFISFNSSQWMSISSGNYALKAEPFNDLIINFSEYIQERDLSLSFWWKNLDYPQNGQAKILLSNKEGYNESVKFAFFGDAYQRDFVFNDSYKFLSYGLNQGFPFDDRWHQIVLTFDSIDFIFKVFIDGEEFLSDSIVPFASNRNDENVNYLKIFSDFGLAAFDNLKIFSGVLTNNEIRNMFFEEYIH